MRKTKLYWIVYALVLVGAGFTYLSSQRHEPVYQGTPLSRWLEDCDLDRTQLGVLAQAAVGEIGADATRTLLRMLGERDGPVKRRLMGNCLEFRALGLRVTSASCYQVRAAAGCRALGPKAEPTIPALVNLLPEPIVGRSAAEALVAIGPKAMLILTGELTNRLASRRVAAAAALLRFGTNAAPAIPALAAAVEDPDAKVRLGAVETLGTIGSSGGVVVLSALTRALRDEDALVRRCGVACLGSLGTKAKEAAPEVSNLERDSDPEVRRVALMALRSMKQQAPAHSELPLDPVDAR